MFKEMISKHSTEFDGAAMMGVTVETNGYHGGDAGHGGFARVVFKDASCTSWSASVDGKRFDQPQQVMVEVRGDSEIGNLRDSLLYAAAALNDLLTRSRT